MLAIRYFGSNISVVNALIEGIGLCIYLSLFSKSKKRFFKGLFVTLLTNFFTHTIFWNEFLSVPLTYSTSLYLWEGLICLVEGLVYRIFFINYILEAIFLSVILNILSLSIGFYYGEKCV